MPEALSGASLCLEVKTQLKLTEIPGRLPSPINWVSNSHLSTVNVTERLRMHQNAWRSSWEMSATRHRYQLSMQPPLLISNYQVAILVDDMIDSGKTLSLAARTLHDKGAKSVHALISHGTPTSGL
jgi:predicted amidophosphoribosyltransferase